jgi:hypothetical protein
VAGAVAAIYSKNIVENLATFLTIGAFTAQIFIGIVIPRFRNIISHIFWNSIGIGFCALAGEYIVKLIT